DTALTSYCIGIFRITIDGLSMSQRWKVQCTCVLPSVGGSSAKYDFIQEPKQEQGSNLLFHKRKGESKGIPQHPPTLEKP
ncbi:hypothetical protein HAX54_005021, partial [Datura stramonium]|nr:hypothetical protein [Datura stramonium]